MNRKNISDAILSDGALVHLDEKPLFHNYAIFQFLFPPSFTSDSKLFFISLTDFSFVQEPQYPIPGSR
jgi:hypothetical protein